MACLKCHDVDFYFFHEKSWEGVSLCKKWISPISANFENLRFYQVLNQFIVEYVVQFLLSQHYPVAKTIKFWKDSMYVVLPLIICNPLVAEISKKKYWLHTFQGHSIARVNFVSSWKNHALLSFQAKNFLKF